jgi:antibiotic biosynthesis monooxygenase (ABM) superfamily enzyme
MENTSAEAAVTKVVDRIPREGMDAQLEQSMKNLIAAALKFPGHLGVTVTRPSLPAQPGFRMVYRFDSCEHLRAWEESAGHARLVAAANRYTQGGPHYDILTGLESWFTLPAQPAMHPKRIRMTVVTWMGIFPLVYLYAELFNRILPTATPVILKVLAVTALVVPTMSYVVAPRLTRLFKDWLYPRPSP